MRVAESDYLCGARSKASMETSPGSASAAMIKCHNKKGRSSQAQVKSIKAGNLQHQKLQTTGHITSTVKGWESMDAGVSSIQLAFSNPIQPRAPDQEMVPSTFRLGLRRNLSY